MKVPLRLLNRKAPGSDGLPGEFYIHFWDVLGVDLVEVFNFCFSAGFLTRSQRRGAISLTFKKGDRLDPGNWRPISLLNLDYKIASRAIAGRLLKVIPLVVHCDQSSGVLGRFIGDTVALLRDFVNYATSANVPVALLSLDQEKAFHRVDWRFLRSVLVHMGFGPSFVGWVELFYLGIYGAVKVNGYLTHFFKLSRALRQGCRPFCMSYTQRSELVVFGRILGFGACCCPGRRLPCLRCLSTLMISLWLLLLPMLSKAVFDTNAVFASGSGSRLNQVKSKGL